MSAQDEILEVIAERKSSRRKMLQSAAAGSLAMAAGAILPGCGGSGSSVKGVASSKSRSVSDVDVLQFALNLEYLEAQYYLLGTTGEPLSAGDSGNTTNIITGDVNPTSPLVAFSNYGGIAKEIATDELNHVRYLRNALTSAGVTPVARPALDLVNSFNAAAKAAGISSSGFNPFANETDFILGAFIFEDVGVTAYNGGAPYFVDTPYLSPAAGILAVEAYHAGAIRRIILSLGQSVVNIANQISALRATADGSGGNGHETQVGTTGDPHIVAAGTSSVAYARTPQEVLNIVYLNATPTTIVHKGGFFPNGLNGNIA